jgi:ABC-type multidrug transport system fused ATPase/permease subunit
MIIARRRKHIVKKYKNIKFLLARSWKVSRSNCLIIVINNLFGTIVPLITIVGLGTVINALLMNVSYDQVMTLIVIYLSVNLGIAILREVLQMFVNNAARKISNIAQFDFSRDSVNVNYHYAQDGTIMNLRRKAMLAYPAFYEHHFGELIKYIVQFIGIISVLSVLSPFFLLLILASSAVSIVLIFKTRKNEFDFQNDKVEEDRKLNYLYKVMTEYSFAKEVRINNAENFVTAKYAGILQTQIQKLKVLYNKSIKINLASTVITIIQTALMYLYFSQQVFMQQITIAEYTILLGTTTLLTSLLLGFFDNIARIGRVCDATAFYDEYKELLEKQSDIIKSNELKEENIDFSNAEIKFENVSFIYPNTDKQILRNINLKISKGEKIGIVGLNGSGKTTFVKLLTRIYDPTEG